MQSDKMTAEGMVRTAQLVRKMLPPIVQSIEEGFLRMSRRFEYAMAMMLGFTKTRNRAVFAALGVKPTQKRRKVKKYWKRYREGR